MKVLITGSTGFIGSHFIEQCLNKGWDVDAVKRNNSNLDIYESVKRFYKQDSSHPSSNEINQLQFLKEALSERAEWSCSKIHSEERGSLKWLTASLDDIDEVIYLMQNSYDLIIHAAAKISFKKKDGPQMIEDNIHLTRNIINAAIKEDQKKIIHVSSIAALGRPSEDRPIRITDDWEESPYNTDYAKSKFHSEMEAWRGKEEGLNVLIVNPGIVLGYAEGPNSSRQVVEAATKGNPFIPAGSNGFVFVEDLVCRTLDLSENESSWNQRHLMVSHNLDYEYLLKTIAKIYNTAPPKWKLAGRLFKLILATVRLLEKLGIQPNISSELLISTSKKSIYENT